MTESIDSGICADLGIVRALSTKRGLGGSYWRVWTASLISNVGDGVLLASMPILASRATTSPTLVGLVATCATLPWILVSLPAGAIVDRLDRRMVLVAADVFRALLVGLLALALAGTDIPIWLLWMLALGLGTGEVFFDLASQAILPTIVSTKRLDRANGLRFAAETTGNTFVGPPLGAMLFAAAAWIPFAVDSLTFLVAAALATTLRGRFRPFESHASPVDQTTPIDRPSWRDDVRSGFAFLGGSPILKSLIAAGVLGNMSFMVYESTFVLFAREELGITERGFGWLLATIGIGAVAGAAVADRVVAHFGRRTTMLLGAGGPVAATALIAATSSAWIVAIMLTVQVVLGTMWSITAMSLRQQLTPNHLYGRVNSVFRFFAWGSLPIGAFAGGLIATVAGLRATYLASAGLMACAFTLIVFRLRTATIESALAHTRAPD